MVIAGDFPFEKISEIIEQYDNCSESLISILQQTQQVCGYLPRRVLEFISDKTKIPPSEIIGAATFYAQFRLQPVGKYVIMVCGGTACHVNGSGAIFDRLAEELGLEDGEMTADGLFTLKRVSCLGCCSLAPAVMINEDVYGKLTPDSAVQIVKDLQLREVPVND